MAGTFNPIKELESQRVVDAFNVWGSKYKEAFVESQHDTSLLHLLLPDDCLIFAGPPRATMLSSGDSRLYPLGFINQFTYTETRQVQPLKGIGSRRHIFASTNSPVQGNIGRMLFHGRNLLNALYACAKLSDAFASKQSGVNQRFAINESNPHWTNLEDDIYRIPFGLGVVYGSPASMAGQGQAVAAEYFEVCTINSKNVAMQSGQAMLMEQVTFMADRVVSWDFAKAPSGLSFKTGQIVEDPVQSANRRA